jgi:multiple sugar transport system permease protein
MSTIDAAGSRPGAAGAHAFDDTEVVARARHTRDMRELFGNSLSHLVLVLLSVLFFLPFLWMLLTSFKSLAEVGVGSWLPETFQWKNYAEVFDVVPFGQFYWNSVFVASWVTFLQVFTSSLAAFSFSRLTWPGRDKVFMLYLATMMLPGLVIMIPNYQIMITLGFVDSLVGLIIPASFSAFGTFLLRQFMLTIPMSLDEAAEIDGASTWRVYWDIILPLSRPGIITLAIFTFIGNYNSFFWPLVMLRSSHKYTLPVGMLFFDSSSGQTTHLLMAAVTMSVLPMIVVFVLLQRHLVKGIQLGAVRG